MIPCFEVVISLVPDSKRVLKHLKSEQELGTISLSIFLQACEFAFLHVLLLAYFLACVLTCLLVFLQACSLACLLAHVHACVLVFLLTWELVFLYS